jgi:hypothetical protein
VYGDCLLTYPPDPLPLIREGGVDIREGLVNNLERADLHSAQFSCKMGETSLRKKFSR